MSQELSSQDPLKEMLQSALTAFVSQNHAARVVSQGLKLVGTGMLPVIDYLCFLTDRGEASIQSFLDHGYRRGSAEVSVSEGEGQVYFKEGYPAIVLVTSSGSESFVKAWTEKHPDSQVFMLGVKVENIENAVFYLEKQGVPFAGFITGQRGDVFRFAVSSSEAAETPLPGALVLVERLQAYAGYRISLPSVKTSSPR